ncbi:hypothetical protein LTR36_007571 [Oleoguttula mirabilis]|uniref:Uncharacterized protein n=1 Tax=Oleoguttula mirabilis TaxID=1507867 RepID=A0AAV9JU85_9PEZI|nr:hypothetical protein LTR36_007571 [Oleoguttula mirabilis]
MAPWMAFVEAWAVQQLLRTPAFHRGVEKVAKGVHRLRHGTPPEELGGTKIDQPGNAGFLGHFFEEVKTQLGQAEAKSGSRLGSGGGKPGGGGGSGSGSGSTAGVNVDSRAMGHAGPKSAAEQKAARVHEINADAAWRDAQKNAAVPPQQGFLGEYAEALRQQLKSDKRR